MEFENCLFGTSNNSVVLLGSTDNHDGIVKGSLSFFHKLFSSTTNDDGASFGLRATFEKVEPYRNRIIK
jgi:hypothetical protein